MANRRFDYFANGAPLTDTDAIEFKKVIDNRKGDPFAAVFTVDKTNELITNKSIGLLQVDSILAAVAAIFVTEASFKYIASACLIVALASCGLLLPNLKLMWPRDHSVFNEPESAFLASIHTVRSRAIRFTWALKASYVAFLLALLLPCYGLWQAMRG